jgi:DnaJ-class molecular chaperone
VAQCMACEGKGQVVQKMAGGPGTMSATCSMCGGVGKFGVNKPADWEETHPKQLVAPEQEAAVA